MEMSQILDANDIGYLVNNFTTDGLRSEIRSSRHKLKGEIEYDWQRFYEAYINSCQLAIDIQYSPRPSKNIKYKGSIEDIKSRIDDIEYIGRFINLRKTGNKYFGLCPFHSDKKSKSFVVYPGSGWHCFGCQRSGDIIDFTVLYKNISVKEVLDELDR